MKPAILAALALGLCTCAAFAVRPFVRHREITSLDSDAAERLSTAPTRQRTFYGARLEPRQSVVLHGAGQSDTASFEHYRAAVAPAQPMLFMTYTDLRDDLPAYFASLRKQLHELAPDPAHAAVVPQIGLSLNRGDAHHHYEGQTAAGADDSRLQQLCDGLRSLDRPVFLRIGYEFNGLWNGYEPTGYIGAFRRTAHHLRGCGLEQVAVVWNWSADAEIDTENGGAAASGAGGPASRWRAYYPGDDAVDWWAVNLFSREGIVSAATREFLQAADTYHHPVMIAESAPKGYVTATSPAVRSEWFEPYFGLIRSTSGIRAFCYIDWDWRGYPQWADWGDSRIETFPALQAWYRQQVSQPLYAGARSAGETGKLLRTSAPSSGSD